ncbi:MAG: GNAT family N-acetyltransferase [Oscillibacter sp.]|nr:GNAT family N-acetyltransferase [Oscillibacter sp.]
MAVKPVLLSDFTDSRFQTAFQTYFTELGISIRGWDGLFQEMNGEGNNLAYLLLDDEGGTLGFLQFQLTGFSNWFFEESVGFIREFWIDPAHRRQGYGRMLLHLTETYFVEHGAHRAVLTADDALAFYLANGYSIAPGVRAKNKMDALVKNLLGSKESAAKFREHWKNITIKEVTAPDAEFLSRLMNDPSVMKALHEPPTQKSDWMEAVRAWKEDDDEAGYIIFDGAVPIGWFAVNGLLTDGRKAFLKMAVLLPAYQGKHIGRYVLSQILERLKVKGYQSVILFTDQDNFAAQKCYANCGFKITDALIEEMPDHTMVARCKMECRL